MDRRPRLASEPKIGDAWRRCFGGYGGGRHMSKLIAWSIHLLTVSGAGLGFVAAVAASRQAWQVTFLCLGIAFIVDALDGPLARWAKVKETLPWFDGAALDFVIDYANYVFIPAFIIVGSGLIAEPLATICGTLIAVVGAFYFGDKRMKTVDYGFRGFPAVWNGVVYLLIIFQPGELVTVAVIVLFALLTFSPIEFIHPVRVTRLRPLTMAITILWAVLSVIILAANLHPGPIVGLAFLAASAYLGAIGAVLQLTRRLRPVV